VALAARPVRGQWSCGASWVAVLPWRPPDVLIILFDYIMVSLIVDAIFTACLAGRLANTGNHPEGI
jgi:hypothetical protein